MSESLVQVLILRSAGANCDRELAHAFHLAGAVPHRVHVRGLLEDPTMLERMHIMAIPGGFTYGDDIASGKILANQLMHHLRGPLTQWVRQKKPLLGVCNGFQVLVKAGLLPGAPADASNAEEIRQRDVTLTYNMPGRFVDTWVSLRSVSRKCIWLPPDKTLRLPIAHGEGRLMTTDVQALDALTARDQVALVYADEKGAKARKFPDNPNGSAGAIAGLCDASGCVLGLMPHPERFVESISDPWRTRSARRDGGDATDGDGMIFFRRAVEYVQATSAIALTA